MSVISLIISPVMIDDISKNRYFKHKLIYQHPFIYSKMPCANMIKDGKLLGEFLNFLKGLNKEVYFIIGELKNHQSELDFVNKVLNSCLLDDCIIFNDELSISTNQVYLIQTMSFI